MALTKLFEPLLGLALNISRTVCPIGPCKVSKESSQQAGFNGVYNFGISSNPGGENWHWCFSYFYLNKSITFGLPAIGPIAP